MNTGVELRWKCPKEGIPNKNVGDNSVDDAEDVASASVSLGGPMVFSLDKQACPFLVELWDLIRQTRGHNKNTPNGPLSEKLDSLERRATLSGAAPKTLDTIRQFRRLAETGAGGKEQARSRSR